MHALDDLFDLYHRRGHTLYGGEAITQLSHALQCAAHAMREGASNELVVASFFHDVGHLVHDLGDDPAGDGYDDRHEDVGARVLAGLFSPAVSETVRLHVDAKRWLCANEPAYWSALSPASRVSLVLQGGPFSTMEGARFATSPHAFAAVQLRRWDDQAKDQQATLPEVEDIRHRAWTCLVGERIA